MKKNSQKRKKAFRTNERMRKNQIKSRRNKENKSSAVAEPEMGDRLATIDMGRKEKEGCCAPFRGDGSHVK